MIENKLKFAVVQSPVPLRKYARAYTACSIDVLDFENWNAFIYISVAHMHCVCSVPAHSRKFTALYISITCVVHTYKKYILKIQRISACVRYMNIQH